MRSNISYYQESKILKTYEKGKIKDNSYYHNDLDKKNIHIEKVILTESNNQKTKLKKIENNLLSNQKFNNKNKKISTKKNVNKKQYKDFLNETQKLNKSKVVKNIFAPKNDLCPYNEVFFKKYPKRNLFKSKNKSGNEIIFVPKINLDIKKENNKKGRISKKVIKKENNNLVENDKKKDNKKVKDDLMIHISDNDDSMILNNEDDNENTLNDNKILNTIFPKLSLNPFLTLNNENKYILKTNNDNNDDNHKIFFSPNNIKKKGRCIQPAQLYYNNINSNSKTKTIISINSSTTQNSNDTINNINIYNLDSKRKKFNDLNSNIYIEGDSYNEKNINISHNNYEIDNILLFKKLLNSSKNGEEEIFLEEIGKIKGKKINFNFHDKENRNTMLHYACQRKNMHIINSLLKLNCNPNKKNKYLQTPLHLASKNGDLEICKILIENGALLNIYDKYKKTPIHYAISNNFTELINYFFDIFIETDTDEKSCYNLTSNKEITSLFKDYFKKENSKLKLIHDFNLNSENKKNKNDKQSTEENNIQKNLKSSKSKTKDITNNIEKLKKIKMIKSRQKNNNNNSHSFSNISIKNSNIAENENLNPLVTNLDLYKNNNKKNRKSSKNMILLKTKNIRNNGLYKPFIQENNKSLSKTNKRENYFEINKTYDESIKIKKKINISKYHNEHKKAKKNNLDLHNEKANDIKDKLNVTKIKHEKTHYKFNSSRSNLDANFSMKEKKTDFLSENKNIKKSKYKRSNQKNKNPDSLNLLVKKNLNEYYNNSESQNNLQGKKEKQKEDKHQNQTMNNIKISKINTSINNNSNFLSLSLNLNPNKENKEKEEISTKSFMCLALLGRGSFGEVYLVQKINSKKIYAMKVLRKERIMGQNLSKYALAERNVLSFSHHPFIVKLYYAFQSYSKLFLIMEYCPGGDLSKHLNIEKRFEENRAKFYLCEILLALEDLHKRNIIFRDLKPDNVILDEEGHCKLTDFGLSKEGIENDQNTKSFCGSIAYLAPEVLKKQGHGKAVDWYLLGVLFYEMLTGITPYYDKNQSVLFYNIEKGKLVIPQYISENAKSLLEGLLQKDPKKRLGGGIRDSEEIKEHIFFKDVDWNKVYEKKLKPPLALKLINSMMIVFNRPKFFAEQNNYGESYNENSLKGWTFINKIEK